MVVYYRCPGDKEGCPAIVRNVFQNGMVYLAVYEYDRQQWRNRDVVHHRSSELCERNPGMAAKNGVWDWPGEPAPAPVAHKVQKELAKA